jgi:murein DD-endopeptidase MepM/ murein hydrolase activator NlpD
VATVAVAAVVIGAGGFAYLRSVGGPANAVGASGASATPATPASSGASATPGASPTAASASPSPMAGSSSESAPVSAVGFRPRATVVPMAFPLPAAARYRYGDGWLVPRVDKPYWYNEIRGVTAKGVLLRAHDGVDLQVPLGTPVLASFDGIVVDPTPIWRPWLPSRYGNVVVIQSSESTSLGYRSIAAHLSRLAVAIGDVVHRGQIVGWTGRSGNAAETIPHLHFELRAPFLITVRYGGRTRSLDSFDPLPSLRACDPRLH